MDSIAALQQKRTRYQNTAQSIIDKALAENRALRPGEEADLEQVEQKIAACNRTLAAATRISEGRLDSSRDRMSSANLADAACAIFSATENNRTSWQKAAEFAEKNLHSPELGRALGLATGFGAFAVPENQLSQVIEALRPQVAVRRLNPVILQRPYGNLTWPRVAAGSQVPYTGEAIPIYVTQPGLGSLCLTARKQAAGVPASNSLLRYSAGAARTMLETDLTGAIASAEDYGFLRGAGNEYQPKGLRSWVRSENVIVASPAKDVSSIDADLSKLELALTSKNVPMSRPGWILAPRTASYLQGLRSPTSGVRAYPEMDDGRLRGKAYVSTSNMPTNLGTSGVESEVILADFADVVLAEFGFEIAISDQAIYVDPVTGQKVSCFSTDQSLVRVVSLADIGMRHDESIAVLTGVTY